MQHEDVVIARDDWSLHRQGHLDQKRHAEKVRDAIRRNLPRLVAEESIILSDGNTIVKVPIRSLEEYHFRYDHENQNHVGQGSGDSRQGDVLGRAGPGDGQAGTDGPGEQPGIDYYEAEITVDELAELIFSDLSLPNLEHKQKPELSDKAYEFRDVRRHGIMANVDRRRTLISAIRRTQRSRPGVPRSTADALAIAPEDLRFKTWDEDEHEQSSAVVLAMMDTSGSMGTFEKYIARSFYFWMVRFLRTRYTNVDILFLAHDTRAREVNEEQFFTKGESGGTKCSSVYELALDILARRYPPADYNVYPFHFSDGDNFPSDNERCLELVQQLVSRSAAAGYAEIVGRSGDEQNTLLSVFRTIDDAKFTTYTLRTKHDVYPALQAFFGPREHGAGP